ncbi:hypothetical protein [Kitasatospora sp. NPDC093806]|uniref:WXG100 family type VII secretion target n=1 Tax=Kitasatospora sp. NPDC093806 TaxID=3155075 RepID=UPI00341EA5BC
MAGGTNFEGVDHTGLRNMVKGSDPSTVLSRGTQLQAAGRILKDLSVALKAHVAQISWEGPAAESFKTWAGNLHQSAALLGDYSKSAGDAMHQAGEALSTAKAAVPEVPNDDVKTVNGRKMQGAPNPMALTRANLTIDGGSTANIDSIMKRNYNSNWISEADAQAAAHRVYLAHQEAIHQMEKLGQAYDAATTTLNALGTVALPGTPESGSRDGSSDYSKGDGYVGGVGGVPRSPRSGGSYSGGGGSTRPAGGGSGGGGGSVVPRPSGVGPQGPGSSGGGAQYPSRGGSVPAPHDPGGSGSVTPLPTHPVDRPGTGLDSLPTVPTLPGQTVPVGPNGGGPVPYTPGGGPGVPGTPGGGSGPFLGGGPIPFGGTGPLAGGSLPLRGGGEGSVPLNRAGTFGGGGQPAKSAGPGPTGGGPVFGAREAQGRSGAGGAVGGGFGGAGGINPGMGGHGGGGGGGTVGSRGRGFSSTGGGVVGGAKGPVAGGEFTPGGSGLRNRAAAAGAAAAEAGARPGQNGMMGPGMMGGGAERRERERGRRADYLHEDEETWTSGTPKSNPGVIE